MAGSYRARCIVLATTKLGEADLILTMLAQDGTQIRGVAKGARNPGNKRFGARLEPFSVVQLQLYPGRSLETITEVRCEASNDACRQDLDKSAACALMAELTAKDIYDIRESRSQALLIAEAFCVKALALLGVRPALRSCAVCGGPLAGSTVFDLTAGGCLCADCAGGSGGSLDPALIPWIDALLGLTFAQLSLVQGAPCLPLLVFAESWAREHLGIGLKAAGFLRASLA